MTRSSWIGALGLGVTFAWACNSVLGIDEGHLTESGCLLNSDCAQPGDVCVFEVCSPPCEADRDCDSGARCLETNDGRACVEIDVAICGSSNDCPDGTRCLAGHCRSTCETGSDDCPDGQICNEDLVCQGTDVAHDPAPYEGSGGAGSGGGGADQPGGGGAGAAKMDTGGAAGSAGTTGEGRTGGAAGTAGLGGDATGGVAGAAGNAGDGGAEPECTEGEIACVGTAQTGRVICDGGAWVAFDSCQNGQLCDRASNPSGECAEVPAECLGRTPGEGFCDGLQRMVCGPDLVTVTQVECESVQHCTLGTGADCAGCLPGEYACQDNELYQCNGEHTFVDEYVDTCDDARPCNPEAGACTPYACDPAGSRRCNGDVLEECNSDRSAFVRVAGCGEGLCDPIALECDVCVADTSTCETSTSLSTCSSDGQVADVDDCDSAAPYCDVPGRCVACTEDDHCTPSSDCVTGACNLGSGECEFQNISIHTECDEGYCDGDGNCVQCTLAAQCTASGECYEATCSDNTCGQAPKEPGEACQAGTQVCDGEGSCVECVSQTHCDGTDVCHDQTCVTAIHDVGWPSPFATGASALGNWMYMFRLPALGYDATLQSFGVISNQAGATARMALYADDGGGTQPSGAPLAETVNPIGLADGVRQQTATPANVPLSGGSVYWIVIVTNTNTQIRYQSGSGVGWRAAQPYGDPFPSIAGTPGLAHNNQQWNVYIVVQDTE